MTGDAETRSNAKVLIIDDEPNFASALRIALEAKSYQVTIVSHRREAEERINTEEPDAIVLGTMSPRGEAFSLYRWLREIPKLRELPVLVIDCPVEKHLIKGWRTDERLMLGSEDYLERPVEPGLLVRRIEKLLDRKTKRIRVLVADDHKIVREGIVALLALESEMQVVGEAANGREAVEKALSVSPDVILMDIVMPAMSGLEATAEIRTKCPQVKVLIVSQYDDKQNMLVASQAGAYGFISKRAAASKLVAGIRSVYSGRHFEEDFV